MRYSIRHVTKLTYETAISESVMEARMQPRTEGTQRCVSFRLTTMPGSRVMRYQDPDGNLVHHFNIPGQHSRLAVTAEALVECTAPESPPSTLCPGAWQQIDERVASGDLWDFVNPSAFTMGTPSLDRFGHEIGLARSDDPLSTVRRIMEEVHRRFEYAPRSTRVDSPIEEALTARRGVCQDFSHIFIALVRQLGIPCRYVSGYVFHQTDSAPMPDAGATHAWAETWLPLIGWTGWDPTNCAVPGDRHIRVAVGRDYADVPPTRGVFKGVSVVRSELAVGVTVGAARSQMPDDPATFSPWLSQDVSAPRPHAESQQQQ